jgi:hypothetical protein
MCIIVLGGILIALAIVPSTLDYDAKVIVAVFGIVFMIFGIIGTLLDDMWG